MIPLSVSGLTSRLQIAFPFCGPGWGEPSGNGCKAPSSNRKVLLSLILFAIAKKNLAIVGKKTCNITERAVFCRKVLEWQQLWGPWVLQCQGVIAWRYVWGVCGVAKAFDGADMSNVCVGAIAGCYVWFPLLSLLTLWQGKVSLAMSESLLCAIFLRYC